MGAGKADGEEIIILTSSSDREKRALLSLGMTWRDSSCKWSILMT